MDESYFDIMERMESLIPEYSYTNVKCIIDTDTLVKKFLVSEIKIVKDYMFHVVQASYELQRDKLSEAAEDIWDEVKNLVSRIELAKICKNKTRKECEKCREKMEKNITELIRKDRELVIAVKDMKGTAYMLQKALFEKGKERYFIKNLNKIKNYSGQIISLLYEREKNLPG